MHGSNAFPQNAAGRSLLPASLRRGSGFVLVTLALLVLLACLMTASLFVGDVKIAPETIADALVHYDANCIPQILVHDGRLPRTLANVLVGAALAVAGAMMQSVTRNPLASPGILGLNNGASFCTLLALAIWPSIARPELMLVAMLGSGMGVLMVYGIASLSRSGLTHVRLALTGVAVSALIGAIGNGVTIYWDLGQDMLIWESRGTAITRWTDLAMFAPFAAVGLIGAITLAPMLSVMMLGEPVARGLGQRTKLAKWLASAIVLVLVGGANSLAGSIGFVGLMVPHVVRYLVGMNYRLVIPGSALGGAMLMLVADIIARLATAPNKAAVPVSAVTAILGVPFFLYLACRRPTSRRDRGGDR